MKAKDLKIGEEYAFAAPNSYDAKRPAHVRVVQTGVYGNSSGASFYRGRSAHPNFVEFEVVDGYIAGHFKVALQADGKLQPRRATVSPARYVQRGPAANFLRLWSEEKVLAAGAEKRRRKDAADNRILAERSTGISQRFGALGFHRQHVSSDRYISFSLEQAEKLLGLLE